MKTEKLTKLKLQKDKEEQRKWEELRLVVNKAKMLASTSSQMKKPQSRFLHQGKFCPECRLRLHERNLGTEMRHLPEVEEAKFQINDAVEYSKIGFNMLCFYLYYYLCPNCNYEYADWKLS